MRGGGEEGTGSNVFESEYEGTARKVTREAHTLTAASRFAFNRALHQPQGRQGGRRRGGDVRDSPALIQPNRGEQERVRT